MIEHAISMKYMIAGYTFVFVVLGIYLASLYFRWRGHMRSIKTLEEIEKK